MKIMVVYFTLASFAVVSSLIISAGTPGTEVQIPTLDVPEFDVSFPNSCSGFFDCTEYLADVLKAVGESILFVVQLIFNIISFIFAFFLLILELADGVEGAPPVVNLLFITGPIIAIVAIMIANYVRGRNQDA